jgi:simple sugar transport system substrate-binding protein
MIVLARPGQRMRAGPGRPDRRTPEGGNRTGGRREAGKLSSIKGGSLGFTIDQQPYLQGFLPVIYLYLFLLSGGLVSPPETNTGLTFVTKSNVGPYLNTTSRYEGSSTAQKYIKRSGPIT